jgi:mono/diheme cytochrome c family protein
LFIPSFLNGADLDPTQLPPPAPAKVDFARDIKPLLEASCLQCHGTEKARSGFRLDSRDRALVGGDHGVNILPGDSAKSPLAFYVSGLVPDMQMPPSGKGQPLTAAQIGLLRTWIDSGAKWDEKSETAVAAALEKPKSEWWSLKPIIKPSVPSATSGTRIANPVDAFVVARLAEKGLSQSPEADRRTLIRRLYFDLIGLPPTPEEVEGFLADEEPAAYEKLADRLLASARYGERWARHWLDVVHYGETHGYDKDQPRPNAWPYRDYVIRSFNEDKPYGRFVQEQLAGDVLFPDTRDGFEALGFIASGPWDLIGHVEVPESKMDGQVARHLDRDDMVANTIQTFNSLTVQCAQCHNHKFDPISQEDYYSLQAVFAALDRADKKYDTDPSVSQRRRSLFEEESRLAADKKKLEDGIIARAGQPLVDLEKRIASLSKAPKKGEAFGYHSGIEKKPDATKWVQVDLGCSVVLGSIVLHPCRDDFNGIGEGFGFPARFKVELSDDEAFREGVILVGDHTQEDFPNPKLQPVSFEAKGRAARYIRVTATRLALRQDDYHFALAELSALTADGNNAALGAAVSALDSIESGVRWQKKNLTDGWHPGTGNPESAGLLAALQKQRTGLLAKATTESDRSSLTELERELEKIKVDLAELPPQSKAYVAAVYTGSGAFAGTGGKRGQPRTIHVLSRGNVQKPGKEMGPGALSCLADLPSRFELPPPHKEGERRAALARWLTDRDNPLTWRSIVNRVWQYHFGRGLVETPNDFGHAGALPTHPELLDWLAIELRDGGQSWKALHKLIVTSATYKQTSKAQTAPIAGDAAKKSAISAEALALLQSAPQADSDNRFLWRQNRRKLEAEALRDAVLLVSGKLDLKMGGPGFRDFVIDKPEHSPHYEYHLHDPEDPKSHRRSIYRFIVRSQQQPFMTALDCADPSMQVGRRNESLSPLQALALLNDSLMLTMSKHFAAKLRMGNGELSGQVRRGFYEALGRAPSMEEAEDLTRYAREHGLVNFCRVLFNVNEFVFVD